MGKGEERWKGGREKENENEPSDGDDDGLVLRDLLDHVSPLSSELCEEQTQRGELLQRDEERKVEAREESPKRTFKAVSTASAPVFMGRTMSE